MNNCCNNNYNQHSQPTIFAGNNYGCNTNNTTYCFVNNGNNTLTLLANNGCNTYPVLTIQLANNCGCN